MADYEKVTKGLECCEGHHIGKSCGNCPYNDFDTDNPNQFECVEYMVRDALDLLKEQGKTGKWIDHTFSYGNDIECPFCHKRWNVIDNCTETFDYCPGCGAELS